MRVYTTEHISDLVERALEGMDTVQLRKQYEELRDLWETIPDPALRRVPLRVDISTDKRVVLTCSSSVVLTYVRQQRTLIEEHLEEFIVKHEIDSLEIVME